MVRKTQRRPRWRARTSQSLVAGTTGGLPPPAAATTYATLTVTGATTHTGATVHTGNVSYADGITVAAPSTLNRPGFTTTGNGTGDGFIATGGASAGGDGMAAVAGGGVSLNATLSTLTTYTGNTPQTGDAFLRIGLAGASLTDLGGMSTTMKAQVQTEAEDALVTHRLDELLNADSDIDGVAPPTVGSVFHELLTKTAGSFTYDQTTDSLEAVRDRGDAAWITATGFATSGQATAIQADTDDIQITVAAILVDTGTTLDAAITAIQADLPQRITKNVALAAFPFLMLDSTDHVTGKTGLTITATRSIDGAAFGATANSATEIANGWYKIDLAATDLNGTTIALKFTGTGADQQNVTIVTEPT